MTEQYLRNVSLVSPFRVSKGPCSFNQDTDLGVNLKFSFDEGHRWTHPTTVGFHVDYQDFDLNQTGSTKVLEASLDERFHGEKNFRAHPNILFEEGQCHSEVGNFSDKQFEQLH